MADLISFDLIFARDRLAGFAVDELPVHPVTRGGVEGMEGDPFGRRDGRVERDRAGQLRNLEDNPSKPPGVPSYSPERPSTTPGQRGSPQTSAEMPPGTVTRRARSVRIRPSRLQTSIAEPLPSPVIIIQLRCRLLQQFVRNRRRIERLFDASIWSGARRGCRSFCSPRPPPHSPMKCCSFWIRRIKSVHGAAARASSAPRSSRLRSRAGRGPAACIGASLYGPAGRRELRPAVADARCRARPSPMTGPIRAGTIVISTEERRLYLVLPDHQAIRYGVGVGRPGFEWSRRQDDHGEARVAGLDAAA